MNPFLPKVSAAEKLSAELRLYMYFDCMDKEIIHEDQIDSIIATLMIGLILSSQYNEKGIHKCVSELLKLISPKTDVKITLEMRAFLIQHMHWLHTFSRQELVKANTAVLNIQRTYPSTWVESGLISDWKKVSWRK